MKLRALQKSLTYLVKSRPFELEKPKVIQFPVIDICNSQCQMCRIWENKKSDDITPDALRKGLRNDLYSEVSGVGLNGGEPTLRKDLGALATVLCEELPSLRNISLITNSYKYKEVIARITDVGTVARQHGVNLDVMVSLDGVGEVHDRVRGKPGNFARAQHVIDFITTSPLVASVRIGCTIIKENVFGLHDLFDYAQARGLYIKYRLGVPHQRLYTADLKEPYTLNFEERYHIAEFLEELIRNYEQHAQQKFFYRSLIGQILHDKPRAAGCDWQHRGATITSKGELLYCAVQSKRLGMIAADDSAAAYFGNAAHMKEIIRTKCGDCHHDYMGILPREQQIKRIAYKLIENSRTASLVNHFRGDSAFGRLRGSRRFAARLSAMAAMSNTPADPKLVPTRGLGKKVLVCGWYGTETLGDKAILGGVLRAIEGALGPVELTLVSLHPYISRMTQLQMPELAAAEVVGPEDGARLVKEMDLVVFGGGPLMGISVLADMEGMLVAAQRRAIPVVLAGCGVGPLGERWHNESLRRILALAELRIYRDAESKELARTLGVDVEGDIVAEDPAFTWLREQRGQLAIVKPPPERRTLLLGLRDFPYQQYARGLSLAECMAARERYEAETIRALERLVDAHPDLVVRPLPMCTNHFGDDDRWFYRRIFRGNKKLAGRLDMSLLSRELAPTAYCDAFRAADVAITMRFHALVFALALDLPAVAIDYTLGVGKVHSLARRFDVPYRSLSDVTSDFLVEHVQQLLAQPKPQRGSFEPAFARVMREMLPPMLERRHVAYAS